MSDLAAKLSEPINDRFQQVLTEPQTTATGRKAAVRITVAQDLTDPAGPAHAGISVSYMNRQS